MRRRPRHRLRQSEAAADPELFAGIDSPADGVVAGPAESPATAERPGRQEVPVDSVSSIPVPRQISDGPSESTASASVAANVLSITAVPDSTADLEPLFARLARSEFRSRFRLRDAERSYLAQKGLATIRSHAVDFVRMRLAPAVPPNDGHQTPMRGHPVFIAQHATGCCCRGCLAKWHGIPAGRPLTADEQQYIVRVLMAWITRQLKP